MLRDLFARAKLGVVLVVVVYIVGLAAAPFAAATGPCAATGAPARDERRRAPMCLEVGGQPLPRWRNYQGGRRWRTAASWPRLSSHDNRHLGVRLVRRVEVHEKAQPRTGLAGTPHHKPAARQEVRMLYVGRLHKLRGNLQRLFAGCPSPPSLSSRPASGEPQRLFVRCPSHHVFRRGQTMLGRVRKTVPAQLEATRLARLANVPGEAGGRVNGRALQRESASTSRDGFGGIWGRDEARRPVHREQHREDRRTPPCVRGAPLSQLPSGRFLPASPSAGYFSAAVGADFSVHCGRLIVMRGDLSNRKENTFPS